MIFDNTLYLEKIQKALSFITIGFCIASIIGNLLNTSNEFYIFNIFLLTFIIVLSIFIYFIPGKAMRLTQFLIFLGAGIIAILFASNTRFIGDLVFMVSILIAYIYRFISNYSYKAMFLPLASLIFLRVVAGVFLNPPLDSIDIYSTTISVGVLFLIITYFKINLKQYISESNKNAALRLLATNIEVISHSLDMSTSIEACGQVEDALEEENCKKGLVYLKILKSELFRKHGEQQSFMQAVNENRTTQVKRINIAKKIESIIKIEKANKEILRNVGFYMDFNEPELYIKAPPFEIHYIFQNLIRNAIEAVLEKGNSDQRILISAKREKEQCVINISDTGPGFPKNGKNGIVNPESIESSKIDGGFGLQYVHILMHKHGTIKIRNKKEENGAEITLTFKLSSLPSEKEKKEDRRG